MTTELQKAVTALAAAYVDTLTDDDRTAVAAWAVDAAPDAVPGPCVRLSELAISALVSVVVGDAPSLFGGGDPKVIADDGFEEFWSVYPRRKQASGRATRGDIGEARKAWARLSAVDRAAATAFLPTYTAVKGGLTQDAQRYLRGRRWETTDFDVPTAVGSLPERVSPRAGPLIVADVDRADFVSAAERLRNLRGSKRLPLDR